MTDAIRDPESAISSNREAPSSYACTTRAAQFLETHLVPVLPFHTLGRRPDIAQTLAAIAVLIVGVLVYVADRGGQVSFVPDWARAGGASTPVFGAIASWLPTFAHTFAFASLTAAVLWPWPSLAGPICAGWFVIESLFELGQIDVVAGHLSAMLHRAPTLRVISDYFVAGTFDPLDCASIAFGSAAAYLLARLLRNEAIGNG